MIVDDEEDSSWLIQHMLSLVTDAEVVCFSSSVEALRAFEKAPDRFDLVITDFNMPRITGDQLRERCQQLAPNLKVVLTTASPDWTEELALLRRFDAFLPKPLSITQIRDVAVTVGCNATSLKAA